jgi:hypothetical protein
VFAGTGLLVGVDAAPLGEQSPSVARWWCSSLGWKLVPGEYMKIIYYRMKY